MSTAIEWTDETWNPVVGCSIISPGCHHCYAMRMSKRLRAMADAELAAGRDPGRKAHYIDAVDAAGRWTGKLNIVREALTDPLDWKKPRMVFVNSMSDLFHEEVEFEYIAAVFGAMAFTPSHTFQALTKRAKNAAGFFDWVARMASAHSTIPLQVCIHHLQRFSDDPRFRDLKRVPDRWEWPLKNVWLGVSVEDQKRADERIPHLLRLPAAIRFLSMEPLLEPVDLSQWMHAELECEDCDGDDSDCLECHGRGAIPADSCLDWIIVGGESGAKARPLHHLWVRSIRDMCLEANVPFFFKQWGEWLPNSQSQSAGAHWSLPGHKFDDDYLATRVGKKAAGRMLDGQTWNEFPTVEALA